MFCNKFLSQRFTADSIISRILEHVTSNMKHNGISPIHATCPAHLILLNFITHTILGEEYKSFSSSLCNLLHSPVTSSLLGPNILLNTMFSNTLSFLSSRNVNYQVSHPYKTMGKIIVMIFKFLDTNLEDSAPNNSKHFPTSINQFSFMIENYHIILSFDIWNHTVWQKFTISLKEPTASTCSVNLYKVFSNLPGITKYYQMFTVRLMLIHVRITHSHCKVFKFCLLHQSSLKWS